MFLLISAIFHLLYLNIRYKSLELNPFISVSADILDKLAQKKSRKAESTVTFL